MRSDPVCKCIALPRLHAASLAISVLVSRVVTAVCRAEKATPTRHRPERQHNTRSNRRKQCSPNETKPYSKPTPPCKRQSTPTNGHTPRRMKPTHTRLTYTRMRPHGRGLRGQGTRIPEPSREQDYNTCSRHDKHVHEQFATEVVTTHSAVAVKHQTLAALARHPLRT